MWGYRGRLADIEIGRETETERVTQTDIKTDRCQHTLMHMDVMIDRQ